METELKDDYKKVKLSYTILIGISILVYLSGMFIPVMEVDAAQYASISQELLDNHSFLVILHRGIDYLDKPPLLFWLSALSLKLFGINTFAYKLPSVLALLLAVYSIYKFCRLYYSKETALTAAVIAINSLAFYIMANDCRTDNLLIGFCCYAIMKIAAYIKNRHDIDLYLGFVGIGFAMLAKGPLGLIFPGFTIVSLLLTNKNYKSINLKWLWSVPIIGLILLPMCIGLYQQYGNKGLEFYFWSQSFGRITGESEWNNSPDPFFLVHTFLWCFLPFTIIFIPALIRSIRLVFTTKRRHEIIEYASLGGFMLTFIALSFSRYKLPHYIYIVSPFAALICARYLSEEIKDSALRKLYPIQLFIILILMLASGGLIFYFTSEFSVLFVFLLILLIAAWVYLRKGFRASHQIVILSSLCIVFVNLQLNLVFYPKLLKYQAPSEAAFYLKEQKFPVNRVIAFATYAHSLSFYLDTVVPFHPYVRSLNALDSGTVMFTHEDGIKELERVKLKYTILRTFDSYPVSLLRAEFLNPASRHRTLSKNFIVRLEE